VLLALVNQTVNCSAPLPSGCAIVSNSDLHLICSIWWCPVKLSATHVRRKGIQMEVGLFNDAFKLYKW